MAYKENHSDIRKDCQQDFRARETRENGQIDEDKGCSYHPVHISCPVYRSKDEFRGMVLVMNYVDQMESVASSSCHHKVGKRSRERDQNGQIME